MKDSLPSRYPALRGEMPKGGIEQLTERISACFPLTYITDCTPGRAGCWCLVSMGASPGGFGAHLWVGLV